MESDVRRAGADDLAMIAQLVVEQCREPATHCLHSWTGGSVEDCTLELAEMLERGELLYFVAESDGALVGAHGCEHDSELGRCWLQGPHVRNGWEPVAERLHSAASRALPDAITELLAFLNVKNERGAAFYLGRGFAEDSMRHHEYCLTGEMRAVPVIGSPLRCDQRESFFEVFNALFPDAYYSHERLLAMRGDSHEIFVESDGRGVVGFCVARRAPGENRGEIELVGVREGARRRGVGQGLIATGVSWLRRVGTREISLNVADERSGARRLYEGVGFELRYSGVAYRLRRSAMGAS